MPTLNGRVALVTGAGRGMGAAIATKLAEYGAQVAVTDANSDSAHAVADKLNQAGMKAKAYHYDVTSWAAAQQVTAAVERDLGGIGILVNNAGVSRVSQFLDIDEAEWDRVITINLKGVYLTCRAVLPGMVMRQYGRVVNLGSILSKIGEENFSHYAASKFGVLGLTQAIAAEMAKHGITANTVCPGVVLTPLWDSLFQEAVEKIDEFKTTQDVQEHIRKKIPLGRPQPAEDIAEMVAYLSSDLARNMTGGSYHIDGGLVPR